MDSSKIESSKILEINLLCLREMRKVLTEENKD